MNASIATRASRSTATFIFGLLVAYAPTHLTPTAHAAAACPCFTGPQAKKYCASRGKIKFFKTATEMGFGCFYAKVGLDSKSGNFCYAFDKNSRRQRKSLRISDAQFVGCMGDLLNAAAK